MKILYLSSVFLFCSCGGPEPEKETVTALEAYLEAARADSLYQAGSAQRAADTSGLYASPVTILSARIDKPKLENHRGVFLRYKNVSTKTVSAVRFRWQGITAFGKPADFTASVAPGVGSGQDDEPIKPGKISEGLWSGVSYQADKIIKAWPIEVAFADGSRWELKKEN
jgi:hypothetical protein